MAYGKVKPGNVIGQNGIDHKAGDVIEIPDHQVDEFRGRLDISDAAGNLLDESNTVEQDAQGAAPHERISIYEAEVERLKKKLAEAEAKLAEERSRPAPEAGPVPTGTKSVTIVGDSMQPQEREVPVWGAGPQPGQPGTPGQVAPVSPVSGIGNVAPENVPTNPAPTTKPRS